MLCEVLNPDGTPHISNHRSILNDNTHYKKGTWVGFEQEFFIRDGKNGQILGHSNNGDKQGKFYCGVGSNVTGRQLIEEHVDMCLNYNIFITGTNAEVALGQWEYQVFSKDMIDGADDLWMARYFLERLSEKYNFHIDLHPKPLQFGEWNGSGLHTNFSTVKMRDEGGEEYFKVLFRALEIRHENHIKFYGSDNYLRLTGKYETQSINKFSWGVADRGASIRVPHSTEKKWKGYIEDRRPASNANPYLIMIVISETLSMADELMEVHNKMYNNVGYKEIDEISKKYNGILNSKELLSEYQDDSEYIVDNETMNGSNIAPEEIKFDLNNK